MILLAACVIAQAGCDPSNPTPTSTKGTTEGAEVIEDVPAALHDALHEPDAFERIGKISRILESASIEDVETIAEVFLLPENYASVTDRTVFLAWWARQDAPAAWDWLRDNLSAFEASTYEVVLEEWGRQDPMAAANIVVEGLKLDSGISQLSSAALLRGWHKSGQPGVEAFLFANQSIDLQSFLFDSHTRYLVAEEGPEYLMEWVDGIPDSDERFKGLAVRVASTSISRVSPEHGLQMWEKYKDTPFGEGLARRIGIGWIQAEDGDVVMDWVLEKARQPSERTAVAVVLRWWRRENQEAAMAWMAEQTQKQPIPETLQPGLFLYAAWLGPTDAPRALEIIDMIENKARRDIMTVRVALDWHRYDPEAAEAWLATTEFEPEQREKIEKAIATGKLP